MFFSPVFAKAQFTVYIKPKLVNFEKLDFSKINIVKTPIVMGQVVAFDMNIVNDGNVALENIGVEGTFTNNTNEEKIAFYIKELLPGESDTITTDWNFDGNRVYLINFSKKEKIIFTQTTINFKSPGTWLFSFRIKNLLSILKKYDGRLGYDVRVFGNNLQYRLKDISINIISHHEKQLKNIQCSIIFLTIVVILLMIAQITIMLWQLRKKK